MTNLETAIKDYENGLTAKQAGLKNGISPNALYWAMATLGIPRRHQGLNPTRHKEIEERDRLQYHSTQQKIKRKHEQVWKKYHDTDWTQSDTNIARRLKITKERVRQVRNQLGKRAIRYGSETVDGRKR